MKEIPKEYLVYLDASYKEFEKTKEAYLKWQNQIDANANNQAGAWRTGPVSQKVPELIVKIPLDDGEGGQGEPQDW